MTISLSLIRNERFDISNIVNKYMLALESLYTKEEMGGYLYSRSGGVLGIAFEGKLPSVSEERFLVENVTIASRNISIIKIWHENSRISRKEIIDKFRKIASVNSSFIFLNQNIRYFEDTPLTSRYPQITKKGSVYSSVGQMTSYFSRGDEHIKEYGQDTRGIEYGEKANSENVIATIDDYLSGYIDSNKFSEFIDPQFCGLKHFTEVLHEQDGSLKATFLQNKNTNYNIARYFFSPDIVFCSNEYILRMFRGLEYPSKNIEIRKRLSSYTCNL